MTKRPYEKPTVAVFEASDIAEILGPAQASGGSQAITPLPYDDRPTSRSGSTFGR